MVKRFLLITLSGGLFGLMIAGCPGFSLAPLFATADGTPSVTTSGGTSTGTTTTTSDTAPGSSADSDNTSDSDENAVVAQVLPASVSLDVEELPENGSDETSQSSSETRNIYARVVRSAATVVHRFHRLADRAMALASRVHRDMEDPNQTQVTGTFLIRGQRVNYKADFAAFDFDGDGEDDGSGTALETPVAVRMWVDDGDGYEQFMCALVGTKPSADDLGAGEIYVRPRIADPNAPDDVGIRVQYDRTDADHRWNIAWVQGQIHPRHKLNRGLARVDVRVNIAGDTEKTVRSAYDFIADVYGFDMLQSAVHYLRGGEGLLASATFTGVGELNFTEVCTSLETQSRAQDGECDTFDTQDMTLLNLPIGGEADFPEAFPTEPTF